MTNKQAQELLIQNGQLVADTLRHLADNEIDSDYFAITSTNENGTETECELVITEYARQAAGTVDELVKALEAAEKRIAELEARDGAPLMFIDGDISPDGAEKLAAIIRDFNEETETPAARMARIIRENPHPTNMCDMPSTDRINGEG